MSLHYQKSHHNNVGEYQQSGIPYVVQVVNGAALDITVESGTDGVLTETVKFPYVSRWITVYSSAKCWIAYGTSGLANNNIFLIPAGTTVSFEVKCKNLLIYASANPQTIYVHAGLTSIVRSMFPDITTIDGVGA
jgi:hypothetical protein